jgi:type VI secretion system FHA domain protein
VDHFTPGAAESGDAQCGPRLMLQVRSYQGALPAAPLARCFDAAGGTIGRGPDNALVLPDVLKTVSRVHARIDCADGAWWLTDLGSNPSRLDGRPVTPGARAPLADRGRLEIGAYVLDVTIEALACSPASGSSHDVVGLSGVAGLGKYDHAADLLVGMPPLATDALLDDPLARAAVLSGQPLPGAPFDPLFDPLGAPLRQSVQPATGHVAFAGSEHDHVPPEQFAFVPPAMAREVRQVISIPDDYDPLSDAPSGQQARSHREGSAKSVAPAAWPQPAAPASTDPTLAALLEGLGLDRSAVHERAGADLARLAGRMLRTAVSGTVNVLLSRSVLKREVRLDTTLLLQRDNNPLKFFPDGDSALQQMLNGGGSGYLPAEAALQRAFEDIRGHELAVLAGMRAALQHMLGRFDPHTLSAAPEAQAARGWLGKLPGRRKAQLWDQFAALHSELARASDDDLQALCGSAFNDAYARQAELLREGRPLNSTHSQRDDNVQQ